MTKKVFRSRNHRHNAEYFQPEREELGSQKITVVPQREGRLYLNVSAEVDTDNGMMIRTTSIPIQVGSAPPELKVNGELLETDDGEVVVSMPAE